MELLLGIIATCLVILTLTICFMLINGSIEIDIRINGEKYIEEDEEGDV